MFHWNTTSHDYRKSYQICRSVPFGSLEHIQIDFTIAPLILGPPESSALSAPRHPFEDGDVREGDARSTFSSKSTPYLFCAAGGIGAFLLSTEEVDELRAVSGFVTEFDRNVTGGGGATRRIEREGTDWVDDVADTAEGRAGKAGFRTGRGGGMVFTDDAIGGLFVLIVVGAGGGWHYHRVGDSYEACMVVGAQELV